MIAPTAVRDVAAVAGALLVLATAVSVVGTVIIPRKTGSHLTRLVNRVVAAVFRLITRPVRKYELRDRLTAGQAAVILLVQLALWLGAFFVGFALLVWPLTADITTAFSTVGQALWTFGSAEAHGFYEKALLDGAAMTALVTVTLQIAYLPTLYAAFNRRETEIGLLNSRAGSPSWGPELLARTYYALGSGTSTLDTLPELYGQWERWAVGRHGKPRHLLAADLVPVGGPAGLVGYRAARRAGLGSAVPVAVPAGGPAGPGPALPAQWPDVLRPDRPVHGYRRAGTSRRRRGYQPDLRGVPRGHRPAA